MSADSQVRFQKTRRSLDLVVLRHDGFAAGLGLLLARKLAGPREPGGVE